MKLFFGSSPLKTVSDFKINFLKKSIEIPHFSKNILDPRFPDSVFIFLSLFCLLVTIDPK